jgi:hypothetical protein
MSGSTQMSEDFKESPEYLTANFTEVSIYLSIYLSNYLIYILCLFIHLSHLPIYLSIYLFIYLSPSTHLAVASITLTPTLTVPKHPIHTPEYTRGLL